MVSSVAFKVDYQPTTIFVKVSAFCCVFCMSLREIIVIDEIVPCVVRRIDIDEPYLACICTSKDFKRFEIVALNIQVVRIFPVHTALSLWSQCLIDDTSCLFFGGTFPGPRKLIALSLSFCYISN